jgi:hypothetical protein
MDKHSAGSDANQQDQANLKTGRDHKRETGDLSQANNATVRRTELDSAREERTSDNRNPFAKNDTVYGAPRAMDLPGEPDYLHPEGTPTDGRRTLDGEPVQQSRMQNFQSPELNLRSANSKEVGIEEGQNSENKELSSSAEDNSEDETNGTASSNGSREEEEEDDDDDESGKTGNDEDRTADPLSRRDYADPRRLTNEQPSLSQADDDTPDYMHPEGKNNS